MQSLPWAGATGKGGLAIEVYVVDELMGRGKTSAMISFMNQAENDTRFLYITPYLTEVERIITACPKRQFAQPEAYGTKLTGIKYLLERGENIVSTHKLFSLFDQEIIDLVGKNQYVLVLDEVMSVVETLPISSHDLENILEKYTYTDDRSMLRWHTTGYRGRFEAYKLLCDNDCIGIYNQKAILWLFPVRVFQAFRQVYILTYLFDAQIQKYYYRYYGIPYQRLYVQQNDCGEYTLSKIAALARGSSFGSLIQICESKSINGIGEEEHALSKSWYDRNSERTEMTQLKNNTVNFFRNMTKTKSSFNLWTTYKDYRSQVSGRGYTKGFLSSNTRATNAYKNRTAVAYLVNRYLNPYIKNFFLANGVEVDEDQFALSEMLQFIWRSAIREGRAVSIYVPSSRIRGLLKQWIQDNEKGGC